MEGTIKVHQFIAILKKRLLLILSIGFGSAILSGIYAFMMMTPIYQSSVQILVNENTARGNYDYNSVAANFQYINTYSDFITAPVVVEQVIKDLNLNVPYEELVHQVKVSSNKESQIITIQVENPNYITAVNISNQIAQVFKDEVKAKLDLNNVTILSPAIEKNNSKPINTSPIIIIFIAFAAGILFGYSISFLLEILNHTIKTEQEIESYLNIPFAGSVSKIQSKDLDNKSIQYSELLVTKRSQNKGIGGNVG